MPLHFDVPLARTDTRRPTPARPPVRLDAAVVGGLVFDGLGGDPTAATVGIVADRLRLLAPGTAFTAGRTVDAAGKFVCPGFIDIHSHSDFAALLFPDAQSKVLAGITTEIDGNCGMSAFPLAGPLPARRRFEHAGTGLSIDWTDAAGYLRALEAIGDAVNRGWLVGHANLRTAAMGYAARPADAAERRQMRRLLEEALDAGCLGLSSGLAYAPGCFAEPVELIELARTVGERGGLYAAHIRSEDDALPAAVDEFLDTVRAAGVRGQYSHVKAALRRNRRRSAELRRRLFAERDLGLDFACDCYPYTALCTGLDAVLLPATAGAAGPDDLLRRLSDADGRRRLADAVRARHPEPDLPDEIVVSSVHSTANRPAVGRTLRQWAASRGADWLAAAFDLLLAEGGRVECIHFAMAEDDVAEILSWPFTLIGTDHGRRAAVGPTHGARPHPRAYGTTARFLTEYVRRRKLMSWAEGIRKMTSGPATAAGLVDRGVLRDGAFADLVVFDPVALTDRATYDQPRMPPAGIEHVRVNGQAVVEAGVHTGLRPGRRLAR
jgi:N-acyl-D-amino-acid deacylase